jgi:hypothetical protein
VHLKAESRRDVAEQGGAMRSAASLGRMWRSIRCHRRTADPARRWSRRRSRASTHGCGRSTAVRPAGWGGTTCRRRACARRCSRCSVAPPASPNAPPPASPRRCGAKGVAEGVAKGVAKGAAKAGRDRLKHFGCRPSSSDDVWLEQRHLQRRGSASHESASASQAQWSMVSSDASHGSRQRIPNDCEADAVQ